MPVLKSDSIIAKNRFESLTDAVFAITMTLMILDLKVPENLSRNAGISELTNALFELLVSSEAYILSFIILGIFWVRQQNQFDYVKSVNMRVLILNIMFLLIIGFVPFSVSLIKHYPNYEISFIIYVLNLFIISLILFSHWLYIAKEKNQLSEGITFPDKKKMIMITIVPMLIFILAFIVSFYNKRLALFIVYLDPLYYLFYKKPLAKEMENVNLKDN